MALSILWFLVDAQSSLPMAVASTLPDAPAAAGAPTSRDQRAILTLFVDGGAHGETEVIVRDKDILVSVADLESAGMHSFAGRRELVSGTAMVSLVSLAPAITYKFDDQDLALRISADTSRLTAHDLNLEIQKPADL